MDLITDFNFAEGDRIDLSGIDAGVYTAGNQTFSPIEADAFEDTAGEINHYHSDGETIIQLQTGRSPDPEAAIRISGIHTPEDGWFIR